MKGPLDAIRISGPGNSELALLLKKSAQNAPLTRSPRGNDDDGDGAGKTAWIEHMKKAA